VFIDDTKQVMTEKYTIMSKTKVGDEKYKFENSNIDFDKPQFEGTYVECLEWVKKREQK